MRLKRAGICDGLGLADSLPALSDLLSLVNDVPDLRQGASVEDNVVVLKFGSSVLRTRADMPNAVHEVYRWYREGHRVVGVVSAIRETTNELLSAAQEMNSNPDPYALAELLATGERESTALLGIALDRVGIRARVVDPREIGLLAIGSVVDSEPENVNRSKLMRFLAESSVLGHRRCTWAVGPTVTWKSGRAPLRPRTPPRRTRC
jgi:hypothetical protein